MKKSQRNQQESLYQTIFDTMADGIIIQDVSTGLVVQCNPSAAKMHGYTREEFIAIPFTKFIHPDELQGIPADKVLRITFDYVSNAHLYNTHE